MLSINFKHFFALGNLSLCLLAATQSHAAAVLDPTTEPAYVLAPYAVSSNDVSTGTIKAYRPWLENGAWQGDLIEYNVSSTGLLSTTVDSSVSPPTTTAGGNWSARIQFATNVSADANYWNAGRKIIFHNGSVQKAFDWPNLTSVQKAALDSVAAGAAAATSDMLDYLRGDQSNETDKTGGVFRQRYNLLGDIIHSNPVYVAAPDTEFLSLPSGYANFKTKNIADSPSGQADRAARVYVSANDGMVHAFDAATGNEVWAYVPSMIIGDLDKLAAVPFTHTYFVDGQLSEGDADFDIDPTTYEWHSLLVGGLGSGGKGLFALDITNANLTSESATISGATDPNSKIVFEIDGTDNDVGYIHGKSVIARLSNNKWVVISGNGYGSTSGLAKLLLIDKNGSVTKVVTDGTTSNGLSAPTLVDVNNDGNIDYGYAGDLQGNMWKFDFSNPAAVSATKLYAAGSSKPITTEPDVRIHPNGGRLVYFGTGSLLSQTDAESTATQSAYGIWDGTANTTILTQTMGTEDYTYDPGTGNVTITTRTSTNTVVDWSVHKGWQVDFNISGERMISNPIMRADRLQFVSHNPLTPDRGDAWLLEFNYLNGGTGPGVFLDLNRDSLLSTSDKTATFKIPVGFNIGKGAFSGPEISRVTNDRDTMFINGLFLPLPPAPLTENTHFQGGHIDVDTDSPNGGSKPTSPNVADSYCYFGKRVDGIPVDSAGDPIPPSTNSPVERPSILTGDGLGGATDKHQHEYDVLHNQVYVDYINLEPLCAQVPVTQKHMRVTEVGIPYNKKFLVIVANADLSPGSDLQIGANKWNVVKFQKMMQEKLKPYLSTGGVAVPIANGADRNAFEAAMTDGATSLIFTLDEIKAAGTFRNAFNDRAILDGGLLPTTPGCVKGDPYDNMGGTPKLNSGRWRGGALITQVIGLDEFGDDTRRIVIQNPTDLVNFRDIGSEIVVLREDNIDETVSPAVAGKDGIFETYLGGGLVAQHKDNLGNLLAANPAFLYESTLFWHYDGSCYGTATWAADVNSALNSNSSTALASQLVSLELDLTNAEVKYAQMVLDGKSAKKLAKQQKKIDDLKVKIQDLKDAISVSSVANAGVPTPPVDADANVAPALGPNFRTGRRTWIDLTP